MDHYHAVGSRECECYERVLISYSVLVAAGGSVYTLAPFLNHVYEVHLISR